MNDQKNGFPEYLLDSTAEERINYFKSKTIGHPLLKKSFEKLLERIRNPGENTVILVYGPTGVGKSTLCKRIMKVIIEDSLPSLYEDRGRIPIFYQEAIAPDSGNFDWIDFYERTLEDINEPLIDYKIDFELQKEPRPKDTKKRTLRKAVEQALRQRQPSAFLIDEAQHLTKLTSGRMLLNQLDTIKSISSMTKVPHVLFGTYELIKFRNLSGQLSRRGNDVHFERYLAENEEHENAFRNILWVFQKHMPLREEPNLDEYWDYFYERSIGCVGILKNWLDRTLSFRLEAGARKLSIDDFKSYAHSLDQCIKMAREAIDGEKQLIEDEAKQNELLTLLGLDKINDKENELNSDTKSEKKNKRQPGKRNPKRDKVGEAVNT
jgi:energy-coupling factor transporter ATP-binding protein EcfA2